MDKFLAVIVVLCAVVAIYAVLRANKIDNCSKACVVYSKEGIEWARDCMLHTYFPGDCWQDAAELFCKEEYEACMND